MAVSCRLNPARPCHSSANRRQVAVSLTAPSGTALISPTYNDRGLAASAARAGAAHDKAFGYDPAGRLQSLALTSGVSPANVSWSYTSNPASQIKTETQSNDSYSWDGHVDLSRSYTTNGLNQYESAGGASFCYDQNGNLTADGSSVYLYDIENRLVEKRTQTNTVCTSLSYAGALEAELRYDPLGRLYYTRDWSGTHGITRFHYDGDAMVAEYASNGSTILRRYLHGTNADADDPLVQYEGTSLAASNARYLYADTRGSIVLTAGASGNIIAQNTYDEYGIPSASNTGRFQYTGQMWIPALGMYYYKARFYSPTLGRFLQTDPIGYEDQVNLYAYVANDPINGTDPTGLECTTFQEGGETHNSGVASCAGGDHQSEILVSAPRVNGVSGGVMNIASARTASGSTSVPTPERGGPQSDRCGNQGTTIIGVNVDWIIGVGVSGQGGIAIGSEGNIGLYGTFSAGIGLDVGLSGVVGYLQNWSLLSRDTSQVSVGAVVSPTVVRDENGNVVGALAEIGADFGASYQETLEGGTIRQDTAHRACEG